QHDRHDPRRWHRLDTAIADPPYRDALALGHCGLDLGETAARCAVRGDPAAVLQRLESSLAKLAPGAFEDDVDPLAAGGFADQLLPARLGVVDHHIGTLRLDQLELGLASGRADDMRAGRVCELHEQDAEAACGRSDQYL